METELLDDWLRFLLPMDDSHGFAYLQREFMEQCPKYSYENFPKDQLIYAALKKLVKDGYVDVDIFNISTRISANTKFYISFEGMLFINDGGYEERRRVDLLTSAHIESLDKWNRFYNKVVAWGTGIAGAYALVELAKYAVSYFYQAPNCWRCF